MNIMNTKHRIIITAGLLTLTLASAAACSKDCVHEDTDSNGLCDLCSAEVATLAPTTDAPTEAPTAPEVQKVDVSLSIKDQDGTPMAGAVVTLLPENDSGEEEAAPVTADENGNLTVTLPEGKYTVRYDVLPEYVLGIDTSITVTTGMEPVALTVTNNTPNGTPDRPFVVNEDTVPASIPVGANYTYTLFGANNRTVTIVGKDLEVTFKETTYTPDEKGEISFRITSDSPREHIFFTVANKGSETCETTINLASDPGSMDNPIAIESLGESISVNVPKDGMVYYTWKSTAAGTLTVNSADAINNISLNNLTTSQVTNFTQGSETASIAVNEGDVITVVISTVGGDQNAEFQTVTFVLTLA